MTRRRHRDDILRLLDSSIYTNKDLARILKTDESTISRNMKKLRTEKKIRFAGSDFQEARAFGWLTNCDNCPWGFTREGCRANSMDTLTQIGRDWYNLHFDESYFQGIANQTLKYLAELFREVPDENFIEKEKRTLAGRIIGDIVKKIGLGNVVKNKDNTYLRIPPLYFPSSLALLNDADEKSMSEGVKILENLDTNRQDIDSTEGKEIVTKVDDILTKEQQVFQEPKINNASRKEIVNEVTSIPSSINVDLTRIDAWFERLKPHERRIVEAFLTASPRTSKEQIMNIHQELKDQNFYQKRLDVFYDVAKYIKVSIDGKVKGAFNKAEHRVKVDQAYLKKRESTPQRQAYRDEYNVKRRTKQANAKAILDKKP